MSAPKVDLTVEKLPVARVASSHVSEAEHEKPRALMSYREEVEWMVSDMVHRDPEIDRAAVRPQAEILVKEARRQRAEVAEGEAVAAVGLPAIPSGASKVEALALLKASLGLKVAADVKPVEVEEEDLSGIFGEQR